MSSANGNKITSSLALINTSIIIPYPQFFGISEVNQLVHESTLFLFQHNVFRLQIPANKKVNWGEVEDNKNRQSKALPVNYSSIVEVAERWSDIVENCQNLSNQHFTTFQTLSKPTCPSSRPLVAAGLLRSLLRSPEGNRLKLGFFDFFKTCFAKLHAEGGQLPGGREVKTLNRWLITCQSGDDACCPLQWFDGCWWCFIVIGCWHLVGFSCFATVRLTLTSTKSVVFSTTIDRSLSWRAALLECIGLHKFCNSAIVSLYISVRFEMMMMRWWHFLSNSLVKIFSNHNNYIN